MVRIIHLLTLCTAMVATVNAGNIKPYGAVPSTAQLAWHDIELYGLVCFNMPTFTNEEWAFGDQPPSKFNPTDFNADQIVAAAKAGGLRGLVLVAKHHGGLCLWPTKTTEYSIKNSPWKDGKGDIVKEFANACRKQGLKFGIYCSPWDRNNKDYGKPAYVETYRQQWRELLTGYGDLFELWVDGANGGTGYYGGAREKRSIDRATYYGWDTNFALMKKLQPGAVIFSDVGPDVRWIGNERGVAGDPCWATVTYPQINGKQVGPGSKIPKTILVNGVRNGKQWTPAETDVSTRKGWYYHPNQKPRTPKNLIGLYFTSIGRGTSLNLGLAPDTRGQLHESDVASLKKFGEWQQVTFGTNLAEGAKLSADNSRDGNAKFAPQNAADSSRDTYWATDDGVTNAAIVLDFGKVKEFNVVSLREYLPLGQRVDEWALDGWSGNGWVELARGRAIGARRLVRTDYIATQKLRVRIINAPVCPAISEIGVYREPDWAHPNGKKLDLRSQQAAEQLKALKFGMFICWSFSTFGGKEWTPTHDKDASFFKATGCDTDQWCKTAKEAGMGYILFLTKHHDGFCLWDTATTDKKVTNSPLGIDVLAKLRKSCDKYGIKLAIYFSEGDWNWPGAVDGRSGKGGANPEIKKAQIKELLTNYGPITFWWMDHAVGDGGLSHEDTVKWIHKFQPDSFVGFNSGKPAGRLALRERGRPGPIGGKNLRKYGKSMEGMGHKYFVAEFTYPILPKHKGGAQWFYSLPKHDNLCIPAEKIYQDYLGAEKYGNIFSLDVGPNYEGKLRKIDVETLKKVGKYIRGEIAYAPPAPPHVAASGVWDNLKEFGADKAFDGDLNTRWGAQKGARKGWLEITFPQKRDVKAVRVVEGDWNRIQAYEVLAEVDGKLTSVAAGNKIGQSLTIKFEPVTTQRIRFVIKAANEVPTIHEIEIK